jgi:hypothetical protein
MRRLPKGYYPHHMIRRAWNALKNISDIKDELIWKSRSPYKSPFPLTFPLDKDLVSRSFIRWPITYEWATASNYVDDIRTGLAVHLPVELADVTQGGQGVVCFELVIDGTPHRITIDYFDRFDVINQESLAASAVYFKMQFHRDGYDHARMVPGGFVSGISSTYHYVRPLRTRADLMQPMFDVYGRFGLTFAREVRLKAVNALREQSRFRYEGGASLVRYSRSLSEAASARVGIDLPSNSDFCFRLVDYLAVGTAIVAVPHRTIMHVPLIDGTHIAYCSSTLSDLIDKCQYYLEHEDKRLELRDNAREYFDRFLHRDQLAAYYLGECFSRIS